MSMHNSSDVIVIGAGISGIAGAYHMRKYNPELSVTILEQRGDVGGTWDFFKYPGLRSDSDMPNFGFSFNRWAKDSILAGGGEIKDYLRSTWRKFSLDERTLFHQRLVQARWSSQTARWTLTVVDEQNASEVEYECRFLMMGAGYYAYDEGHTPEFIGMQEFTGRVIHPQAWDETLDYTGKRIVVIGSGATAVTLVPKLAEKAQHVTMLQRSPGYMLTRPKIDELAKILNRVLPLRIATWLNRWRWGLLTAGFFKFCRWCPQKATNLLLNATYKAMGEVPDKAALTPTYNPFEQRLCAVQDGDLFEHTAHGRVSVVTTDVDRFNADGVRLADGRQLDADIIVTATGFNVRFMGGADLYVDDKLVDLAQTTTYRDTLFTGVPNLANMVGYFNNSWTLKVESQACLAARIVRHLGRNGWDSCQPYEAEHEPAPMPYFTPGYLLRGAHLFPRNGANSPWHSHQGFPLDIFRYRFSRIDTDALRFSKKPVA